MKSCKPFHDDFVEALYGDLDSSRQHAFDRHLGDCPECADQFRSLGAALDAMDERELTEPEPGFWDEFGDRVRALAAESDKDRGGRVLQPHTWPSRTATGASSKLPYWAGRIAAGIAILVFGVTLGRLSVAPTDVRSVAVETPDSALDQRVSQYMESSRTLLLGFVNLDPAAEGFEALDLAPYQQASQRLANQSPSLERDLTSAGERRLARLVLELEEILGQIAGLESGGAVEGVRVVRDGVQQRALLFKIHLESTRQARPSGGNNKEKTGSRGSI